VVKVYVDRTFDSFRYEQPWSGTKHSSDKKAAENLVHILSNLACQSPDVSKTFYVPIFQHIFTDVLNILLVLAPGVNTWPNVKWLEVTGRYVKWSEVKWSEVKWSEVKWSEVKWSEVKWSEVKW
jgi:hypothetical protein